MVQEQIVSSEKTNKNEGIYRDEPQLRFPEFNEEWETLKLGDFLEFISTNSLSRAKLNLDDGKIKNIHYGDIHTKFPTIVDVEKEEIPFINLDEDISKFKKEQYCKDGDLIIADASEDYADIGKAIELVNVNIDLVSGLHTILARDKSDKTATGFKGYLFLTKDLRKKIKINANGISVLGISKNNIANLDVRLPSKQEQEKISSFLRAIDRKIELLDKKYKIILSLKDYYYFTIFNIHTLDDLKIEYERLVLDDVVCKFSTGLNPRKNFKLNDGGSNFYVTIKNFENGILTLDEKCDKIDDIALKMINKRSDLKKDDLIFASIGRVGEVYLIKKEPVNWNINESVFSLRADKNKMNHKFLYCLMKSDKIQHYFDINITGSTFKSIKMKDLKKTPITIPCDIEKQEYIADFLLKFDKKSYLLEKQILEINQFKKGLLQKMFI